MASRTLISIEKLPDRSGNTPGERVMMLRADTEETMLILRRRMEDRASRHHVTGWVEDLDGIVYDLTPSKTAVVARLIMTRPD